MTSRPCETFDPGVNPSRCARCGWTRGRHKVRRTAVCASTGKVRHRTRASGAAHVHRLAGVTKAPETLMVYLCEHCRDWHVGHGLRGQDDIATSDPRHQRTGEDIA